MGDKTGDFGLSGGNLRRLRNMAGRRVSLNLFLNRI